MNRLYLAMTAFVTITVLNFVQTMGETSYIETNSKYLEPICKLVLLMLLIYSNGFASFKSYFKNGIFGVSLVSNDDTHVMLPKQTVSRETYYILPCETAIAQENHRLNNLHASVSSAFSHLFCLKFLYMNFYILL